MELNVRFIGITSMNNLGKLQLLGCILRDGELSNTPFVDQLIIFQYVISGLG